MDSLLPKKLASYIHETGLRALDHLAENVAQPEEGAEPDALQTLLGHWRAMTPEQKENFVTSVSTSVGEVIAASALLPIGIKVGKKAVKSAKKILKKSARTLKKNAKTAKKTAKAQKKVKKAEKSAKPAAPAKRAKSTRPKTKKKTKKSAQSAQ
jgi:hypothetical protein